MRAKSEDDRGRGDRGDRNDDNNDGSHERVRGYGGDDDDVSMIKSRMTMIHHLKAN